MRSVYSLWISFILLTGLPVYGQTFVLDPIDAASETQNGINWTIDPASLSLNTTRSSGGHERRGILEFPINSIPTNVSVRNVLIGFDVSHFTFSGDIFPIIQFHGYAGDGVLTVNDPSRPFNLLGESEPITSLDNIQIVELDSAYIQSLLGKSTHLGIFTYQKVLDRQVGFHSTEMAEKSDVFPPKLLIEVLAPVAHDEIIPTPNRSSLIWDPHRNLLYITTDDGVLERFDAASRLLLEPWDIGISQLGADITPDGQFLFVTDEIDAQLQPQIRRVDLDTGAITTWSFTPETREIHTWDIKIVSDTKGFVTTEFNGSGWLPIREFDLATGEFTIRTDFPGSSGSNVTGKTILRRSLDRSTLYVLEGNISSGPMIVYDVATDTFIADVDGRDFPEFAASSPTGDAIVRTTLHGDVDVRDRSLNLIQELTLVDGGVVFDTVRPFLYVADDNSNRIIAFDTRSYEERFRMFIRESFNSLSRFDVGEMEISSDGSLLFLSTGEGVRLYELTGLRREDVESYVDCMSGPEIEPSPVLVGLTVADCIRRFDRDGDGDVDFKDAALLIPVFDEMSSAE